MQGPFQVLFESDEFQLFLSQWEKERTLVAEAHLRSLSSCTTSEAAALAIALGGELRGMNRLGVLIERRIASERKGLGLPVDARKRRLSRLHKERA